MKLYFIRCIVGNEAVRRLGKNMALSRKIVQGAIRVVDPISKSCEETFAFPFESSKLREYANFLTIGLNFHKLGRRLALGDRPTSHFATKNGDLSLLWQFFYQMEGLRVADEIGEAGLQYEALASREEPFISIWRFSFFGGVLFKSDKGGVSNVIWSFLMTEDQLSNNAQLFSSDTIEQIGET